MSVSSSPVRSAPSLRDRLRADTRAAHEALDAGFAGMFADATGASYRRFIAMNRAAHASIEPVLAASPLGFGAGAAHEAGRLAAACRDAEILDLAPVPMPAFPLPHPDLFEAFGIAYVLEGSRLGAKYVSRAMKRDRSGDDEGWPTHYLEASSDARPFTRLIERMDAEPSDEDEIRRAVEAADVTFRFFRALSGNDQMRTTRA